MEFLNLISDENIRTQISTEFSKVLQEKEAETGRLVNEGVSKSGDAIIERDLKPILGIERLPEEKKFSDYAKRAIPAKLAELENNYKLQISELNEKLKAGATDESLKSNFENLKSELSKVHLTLQEKEKSISEIKNEYEQKLHNFKIENEVSRNMPELLNDEINKYKSIVRKNEFFQDLKENFDLKINEKGELIAEDKKTFVSKAFKTLAEEKLSDVLAVGNKQSFDPKNPQTKETSLIIPEGAKLQDAANLIISHIKNVKGSYDVTNKEHSKLYNELISKVK